MPGLLGYMLAVVVVLGGYFAGLHWLINPPDPWQPNPKITQNIAQQTIKKRLPVVKPAEAGASSELTAPAEPDVKLPNVQLPNVETSELVQAPEMATVRTIGQDAVEPTRPAAEPVHIMRREVPPAKTKPGNRKRVERNASRRLELMVLRTYERSDGKRFTRLLPLSSARNAFAFQPDDQW
jgi:hypothetical protein